MISLTSFWIPRIVFVPHSKCLLWISIVEKNIPSSSIQPFLCTEICILGWVLIFSCQTPLKMTFGERFLPFAFTVRATLKLYLSVLQDNTGTVLLPVNSKVLVASSSNGIGVSSLLRIRLKLYPQCWQDLRTNQWNSTMLSSMSAGRCWARLFFALMGMEWWRFQLEYQPRCRYWVLWPSLKASCRWLTDLRNKKQMSV